MRYVMSINKGDALFGHVIVDEIIVDEDTKEAIEYNCESGGMTKKEESFGSTTWECDEMTVIFSEYDDSDDGEFNW